MTPGRRAMDAASHAHKREADPADSPRLHHRVGDDPDGRFAWRMPPMAAAPALEEVPRAECVGACVLGALVGALAGGAAGALLILLVLQWA